MSLLFRLNLVIALSMLLIVGMGAVFTIYSARESVHEEVMSSVKLVLNSIDAHLANTEFSNDSMINWQARMAIPENTRHLSVQLIPIGGQPVIEPPSVAINNPLSVPGWFMWWVKPAAFTATRTVQSADRTFQIVIHDNPNDEIIEAWGEARGLLGLIVLQSLLIWVLAYLMLGRTLKSVPAILNGLERIEAGDYQQRLPEFSLPEFSKISAAFNYAAQALETSSQENLELTRRSLTLQEEERRLLSQELHDELGQSLSGIKVIVTTLAQKNPGCQDSVTSVLSICDHLFSVVRSMMRRLRPTVLDELGLAASLEDMLDHWQHQNPRIAVILNMDPALELPEGSASIHLFRIVQESLNNIARHAEASEVTISLGLKSSRQCIILSVTDNGHGYDPEAVRSGFGLLGMRERAESLGGHFKLKTQVDSGTTICVEIPCQEACHE